MTPPTSDTGEKPLRILRGRVDEVRVYEVTDAELERLEKGSPESLNFNAGIFFLSTGISTLVSILTTKIESSRTFTMFALVTVVGFSLGALLIVQYAWNRRGIGGLIKTVKGRIPPEAAVPPVAGETSQ